MAKLPVGDTLAFSLRFGLNAIPALFRVGWVPLLVFAAGVALLIAGTSEVASGTAIEAGGGYVGMKRGFTVLAEDITNEAFFVSGVVLAVIGVIFLIPVQVAMLRKAAGQELPGGFLAFRWNGPVWRYIGASLLTIPIFLLVILLAVIPAILAVAATEGLAALDVTGGYVDFSGNVFAVVALVLAAVFLFWFSVRFSFFATYAAVENRIAPVSAFRMTGGNFWRIVGAGIIIGILALLIEAAFGAFEIAFGALSELAGVGAGEGAALPIVLAAVAFLLAAVKQVYTALLSTGFSGRVVGVLADERA